MIKVDSDREFNFVVDSFSTVKKINLKDIGFNQISGSNLYIYQSDEYKILNYSIKPQLTFLINTENDNIAIKLENIRIKNLPNIFKTLKLTIEVNIFPVSNFCKIIRHISLKYESKNKLIRFISENFTNNFFNNLLERISIRFDRKLIKKISITGYEEVYK